MPLEMTHIVACNSDGIIGLNGKVPWKCPEDMEHFKATTSGNIVIMGRKTYDSISGPLKNRINIIISRQPLEIPEGVILVKNTAEAYQEAYSRTGGGKIPFIIGGEEIYRQTINHVTNIQLTMIGDEKYSMRGKVSIYPLTTLKRFQIEKTRKLSNKCTLYYLKRKGI